MSDSLRILVLLNKEWTDESAAGNTYSNWFCGMENTKFYAIYRRNAAPKNNCCEEYFTVTPNSILKNFFSKEKIGKRFNIKDIKVNPNKGRENGKFEKIIISAAHKLKFSFLKSLSDGLYSAKNWDNKKFRQFLAEADPDIIFATVTSSRPSLMIAEKIKQYCKKAKLVGFIADDVYGISKSGKKRNTVMRYIDLCDRLYGASDLLCEEYGKIFRREIIPLYKGCIYNSEPLDAERKNNIDIIYAGNMFYGRDETLIMLAKSIEKFNKSSKARKFHLNIYCNSSVPEKTVKSLNIDGCSHFYGLKPYEEIKRIMDKSDMVLHVESFKESEIKKVRYSFSTKIIDCLQSKSVFMVIGPKGIASVEYARKIPGVVTVDSPDGIYASLCELAEKDLHESANLTLEFSQENHNLSQIQTKLRNDFILLGENNG